LGFATKPRLFRRGFFSSSHVFQQRAAEATIEHVAIERNVAHVDGTSDRLSHAALFHHSSRRWSWVPNCRGGIEA
jgi:hypothetical protein